MGIETLEQQESVSSYEVPPQYKGWPSELVEEFISDGPIFVDDDKNVTEGKMRQGIIEASKKAEVDRETRKRADITERYNNLSVQQIAEFPDAQKAVWDVLARHVKQEGNIDDLSREEHYVLGKLQIECKEFKEQNPGQLFHINLPAGSIDEQVRDNLLYRLALKRFGSEGKQSESQQSKVRDEAVTPNVESSIGDRKNLSGWDANFELAKIAKQNNIDLSIMSREEYAQFAIDNSLAIDDDQLRMSTWQRNIPSFSRLITERKRRKAELDGSEADKLFAEFDYNMREKARTNDRYLGNGIKVRAGTKDSNSWLFFGINGSLEDSHGQTPKSYISLKDLGALTPNRFILFMEALRDAKYDGDIKSFQDLANQGVLLNDQLVMHGRTEDDAKLALQVAESFFGKEILSKGMGMDEVVDGKNRSYSQLLATKIKESIN